MNSVNRKQNQAGLTLLEVVISLAIISSATIGMNMVAERFSEDTKVTIAASQVRTFGEAAKAYIKDNYAAVQGVATPTTPAMIDVPTLITSGHLTTGFVSTNAYGQSLCALVLEPIANRLQAMVVSEGGNTIDDLSLGSLAAIVGGSGGGTYSTDPSVIRGAIGGWTINTSTFDNRANNVNRKCDGAAGNVLVAAGTPAMALWFENGDTSSAFLARDPVPGRPELNEMNTPVVMNAVQIANDVCTRLGAIARDAAGAVLSCQGGQWKSQGSAFWRDPAATYAVLPACNAAAINQTRVVQTPTVGVGPRAYTCDGATWQPLAVDDGGNLTVAGQLSVGANNRILGNGAQGSYGATTVAGQKNGWTGVEYRDSSGNYQVNQMTNRSNIGYYDAATGRWLNYSDTSGNQTLDQTADMASGRINPGWAVETWGCSTGQIAKAAYTIADGWAYNGKTLSCVNGVWKNRGESKGTGSFRFSGSYGYCVAGNPLTGGCSCPAGSPTAYMGLNDTHGWAGWVYEYICF